MVVGGGMDRKAIDDGEIAYCCFHLLHAPKHARTYTRTYTRAFCLENIYIVGRRTLLGSLLVSDAELKGNTRIQQQRERQRVCVFFFSRGTYLLVFYTQTLSLSLFYLTFKSRQIRRRGRQRLPRSFSSILQQPRVLLMCFESKPQGETVSFAPLTDEPMRSAEASS